MFRFEGVSLPVADLDRSILFYQSLGFVLEGRSDRFALLRQGNGTIGLLRVGAAAALEDALPHKLRALVQIELTTDDLDGLYAELTARGVAVRPPRDRGYEVQMQLRDPDGFTVEFAQGHRGESMPPPTESP